MVYLLAVAYFNYDLHIVCGILHELATSIYIYMYTHTHIIYIHIHIWTRFVNNNPKPYSLNPKLKSINLKPQTLNPLA